MSKDLLQGYCKTGLENRMDGAQVISVNFNEKGRIKSQVTVQHGKLPDARAAEKMKAYWGKALQRLKAHLES